MGEKLEGVVYAGTGKPVYNTRCNPLKYIASGPGKFTAYRIDFKRFWVALRAYHVNFNRLTTNGFSESLPAYPFGWHHSVFVS
uniref:hypothetical protein n=1 Tax=Novosphingobium huizhouense TaxID=2866625 RepID=UPI001CD88F66